MNFILIKHGNDYLFFRKADDSNLRIKIYFELVVFPIAYTYMYRLVATGSNCMYLIY